MKKLLLSLFFLFVTIACKAGTARTDTVVLYNGQILIGEIQSIDAGVLRINDADLGQLKVKLYKIRKAYSIKQFRIVSIEKKEYFGYFRPSDKDGYVHFRLSPGDSLVIMPIEAINEVHALEKGFWKRLNGNATLGFSFSKSSSIGQFNLGSTTKYTTKLIESTLTASALASLDSISFSRDNENVELLTIYNFSPSWFGAVALNYQRNLELSIARRYQQMIGGGTKLLTKKHFELLGLTGLAFNQEKSTSSDEVRLLMEIPVSFRLALYFFSRPNIQITTSQGGFISLSEKGRIRYSGTTSLYFEVLSDFYLNITSYANYDSKPPDKSATQNKFDFGGSFGVSYKF
jgi:hypothetical protein